MSYLIGRFGYAATADDVARWFGLTGPSQFPADGIATSIYIQHHEIWVSPKRPTMTLRAMTRCLDCGKVLPVGRLAQHDRRMHSGASLRAKHAGNRPHPSDATRCDGAACPVCSESQDDYNQRTNYGAF